MGSLRPLTRPGCPREIRCAAKRAQLRIKATIDIPDELYRRVKAQSAMLGRPVREVTIELYRRWLGDMPAETSPQTAGQWLAEWQELGDSLLGCAADGPTATEVLAADRDRLERP